MTTLITDFVPAEIDATTWDNLQPQYQQLLDRELKCAGCLEQLILDRSELDAAADEAYCNLYIAMTCDTEDESIKAAFLAFVEQVEPELKKVRFELDKKIVSSEHVQQLDQERFGVLLRNWGADVAIFRDENVPLQTEDTKLGTEYAELCGAMMVNIDSCVVICDSSSRARTGKITVSTPRPKKCPWFNVVVIYEISLILDIASIANFVSGFDPSKFPPKHIA